MADQSPHAKGSVVVENPPGAGTLIARSRGARRARRQYGSVRGEFHHHQSGYCAKPSYVALTSFEPVCC